MASDSLRVFFPKLAFLFAARLHGSFGVSDPGVIQKLGEDSVIIHGTINVSRGGKNNYKQERGQEGKEYIRIISKDTLFKL